MRILALETSCDETAAALADISDTRRIHVRLLSSVVSSQIALHAPYGGVVPFLAQREHRKNISAVLAQALAEPAKRLKKYNSTPTQKQRTAPAARYLTYEPELLEEFTVLTEKFSSLIATIDAIAVTKGPGLEPALWVGVNAARALATLWHKPLVGVNHLEGHIFANYLENEQIIFPALALIVSGGHTELVLITEPGKYKIIGETRDDAAGEAFDKAAKILGLPYPGGPQISQHAQNGDRTFFDLPRPMLHSADLDFSFSGLKTALLYLVRPISKKTPTAGMPPYSPDHLNDLCASFEQAVLDVLIAKTAKALKKYRPQTLIIGGGVSANTELRKQFSAMITKDFPHTHLLLAPLSFTGDNAAMIAVAGYFSAQKRKFSRPNTLRADGGLDLA